LARPNPPPSYCLNTNIAYGKKVAFPEKCPLPPPLYPLGGVDSTFSDSSAQTFVPYISQCLLSRGTVVASPLVWLEHWTPCPKQAEPYQVTLG